MMTGRQLINAKENVVGGDRIAVFRTGFQGEVIRPGDPASSALSHSDIQTGIGVWRAWLWRFWFGDLVVLADVEGDGGFEVGSGLEYAALEASAVTMEKKPSTVFWQEIAKNGVHRSRCDRRPWRIWHENRAATFAPSSMSVSTISRRLNSKRTLLHRSDLSQRMCAV
jgi:hypothetical protein